MHHVLRAGLTAIALFLAVVVGVTVNADRAYSQGMAAKGDGEAPSRVMCQLPFALLDRANDHRVLTGSRAEKYFAAAGIAVPPGTDVAFKAVGNNKRVAFVRSGCVVTMVVIPKSLHRQTMVAAFGVSI